MQNKNFLSSNTNDTAHNLRRIMLAIMAFMIAGTTAELLLIEHFKSGTQWIAVAMVALAALAIGLILLVNAVWALRVFQVAMVLVALSGAIGVKEHLEANLKVAQESQKDSQVMTQILTAFKGFVPALAPGALVPLGLLGLAFTYKHPMLNQ